MQTLNGPTHALNGRNGHAPNGVAARPAAPLDAVSDGAAPPPKGAQPKTPPPPAGRGPGGRFAPGNRCARGNPQARRMAALRSALQESATPERLKERGEALYKQAAAGDTAAAKLWLSYVVGRPPGAVDADRLDLDEYRLWEAAPSAAEVLRALVDGFDPALAAEMLGVLLKRDPEKAQAKLYDDKDLLARVVEIRNRRDAQGPRR
jgi:hypothetical protein